MRKTAQPTNTDMSAYGIACRGAGVQYAGNRTVHSHFTGNYFQLKRLGNANGRHYRNISHIGGFDVFICRRIFAVAVLPSSVLAGIALSALNMPLRYNGP